MLCTAAFETVVGSGQGELLEGAAALLARSIGLGDGEGLLVGQLARDRRILASVVVDSVAAPDHGLFEELQLWPVGETESRRIHTTVRVDERTGKAAAEGAALSGLNRLHFGEVRVVIKVHQPVVFFDIWGEVLVAQPEVQREVGECAPIILGIPVKDVGSQVGFFEAGLYCCLLWHAQQEVGKARSACRNYRASYGR